MDKKAYQPPLDSVSLLPPPNFADLTGLADIASDLLLLHAGKVACNAKGIFKENPPDSEGDALLGIAIPDLEGDPTPCLFISFLSEEKVDEEVIVMEAGVEWEETRDLPESDREDEFADAEKVAVISVLFNRRWSAHSLMKHAVFGFYELLETLSHEIAHVLDKEHTLEETPEPAYESEKGQKAKHKYVFDDAEVRARVWAGLAVYSHVYLYATIGERWEDLLSAPDRDSDDEKWSKFVDDCPIGDMPLEEFNDENRALFIAMLRTVACDLRDFAENEGDLPRLLSAVAEVRKLKLAKMPAPEKVTDDQWDEACRILAEHCAIMWEKEGD